MKVRCNPPGPVSGALTPGKEYVVLSVAMVKGRSPYLRIVPDDGVAESLFDSIHFSVVDPRPSSRWVVGIDPSGTVEFAPPAWLADDFWDRFYGDVSAPSTPGPMDLRAYDSFREEVHLMNAE